MELEAKIIDFKPFRGDLYPQPSALKVAMKYRGMKQKELAANVPNLSQSVISNFLNGKRLIDPSIMEDAMRYLNFPMAFIYQEFKPLYTSMGVID